MVIQQLIRSELAVSILSSQKHNIQLIPRNKLCSLKKIIIILNETNHCSNTSIKLIMSFDNGSSILLKILYN